MKVLLLGATGLTGGKVLNGLLETSEVTQVVAPVRRPLGFEHAKLHQPVVDFDRLDDHKSLFAVDVLVCCLGSTIKKAGSRDRFRAIDYGIPMKAAEMAHSQGAEAFIVMSAVGASASSPMFYNRVKGELEDGLKALGFRYLSIYQPGLLIGERAEQRLAESIGIKAIPAVNCLLQGPLKRYRGIEAATVAKAMVNEVVGLSGAKASKAEGVHYLHYDDMLASANSR